MLTAKITLFMILFFLSIVLLYWIIKTAVYNGVREANENMLESVRQIEKLIYEIRTKKESS